MFVFDVSDTEPLPEAPPLPREMVCPFEVRAGSIGNQLERTIENAKRDGIRISNRNAGSQSARQISPAMNDAWLEVVVRSVPSRETLFSLRAV